MRYIKDFYNYNKTLVYVIISVLLVIVIGLLLYLNFKNDDNSDKKIDPNRVAILKLFGDEEITIFQYEKYIEPGYYALMESGEIKTDEVIVTPTVLDTSKPGEYYINYVIGNKKTERKVTVLEKEEKGLLTLELLGDTTLILQVGDEFEEPGYEANDDKDGDLTDEVEITGKVDITKSGTYTLTYEVTNSNGETVTKKRTVVVNDSALKVDLNKSITSGYTKKNITITIEVTGTSFSYVKGPNNIVSNTKISNYEITKNGTYKFYVYDKKGNYITKEVIVTEIDKKSPTGTCTLTNNNGKSTINVSANDDISGIFKYEYYGNNNLVTTLNSSSFTTNNTYNSFYVNVYDKAGNSNKLICSINNNSNSNNNSNNVNSKYDYLEMHMFVSGHYDDAILIRTSQATILIDSGRAGCYAYVGPYLTNLGVTKIDAMIGSHTDADHIEAQAQVIKNFKVVNAYYPVDITTCASIGYCDSASDVKAVVEASKQYNIPLNVKKAGEILKVGDMTLYFIGPAMYKSSGSHRGNSNSYIFILKFKNTTIMFPGDAGSNVFNVSTNKPFADKLGISLKVDVLKYPHHGNASIESVILNAMSPKYILIPNYKSSKYPSSSNEQKLKNIGATVYENASDGNIVLISDGNNITIKKNQKASDYKR